MAAAQARAAVSSAHAKKRFAKAVQQVSRDWLQSVSFRVHNRAMMMGFYVVAAQ